MFGFGLLRLQGECNWAHLQVSHSARLSLLCTKSPSNTEQFTAHLQLPSRSSAYSKILWEATSIPTAALVSSFQFIFRLYHCSLYLLAPLPERMSSNCSSSFESLKGLSHNFSSHCSLELPTAIRYAKCISSCQRLGNSCAPARICLWCTFHSVSCKIRAFLPCDIILPELGSLVLSFLLYKIEAGDIPALKSCTEGAKILLGIIWKAFKLSQLHFSPRLLGWEHLASEFSPIWNSQGPACRTDDQWWTESSPGFLFWENQTVLGLFQGGIVRKAELHHYEGSIKL